MIAKSLVRIVVLSIAACCGMPPATAQTLLNYEMLAPRGLERAWFSQVQVDVSRHRVRGWELFEDNLLAVTSSGLIHSFNAETGETLWTAQPGPLDQPLQGPAANSEFVAVVSGAQVYVLDRTNGRLLWSRALGSAPAAAPALSKSHVFVSFFDGRIEAYHLEKPETYPWYSQSVGRIHHSPTATGEVVSWPTSRGYLYVARAATPKVLYRIETAAPATAPPTGVGNNLYVTSADGHAYCFNAMSGEEVWRYSMGYTSPHRAAVVGDRAYVASSEPMLHALDSQTGEVQWTVPDVTRFAAQGLNNVYGLDDFGRLMIVDLKTGKYMGSLPGANYQAVFNDQSDRIFLIDDRGLVQCLHEVDADEPTMYRAMAAEESEAPPTEEAEAPPVESTPEPTVPLMEEEPVEEAPSGLDDEDLDNPFEFEE